VVDGTRGSVEMERSYSVSLHRPVRRSAVPLNQRSGERDLDRPIQDCRTGSTVVQSFEGESSVSTGRLIVASL
jgi:hypothetical protein